MTTSSLFSLAAADSEDCGLQRLHRLPHEGTLSSHPPAAAGADMSPRYTPHPRYSGPPCSQGIATTWSIEMTPEGELSSHIM